MKLLKDRENGRTRMRRNGEIRGRNWIGREQKPIFRKMTVTESLFGP